MGPKIKACIKNSGQWGVIGWPREPCCAILALLWGWGWHWTLTMETAASISLFTRLRASSVFGRHSGNKQSGVVGWQMSQTFPGRSPLLTDPGLPWLTAKWPVHLGRRACPWAHGSSSAALTSSVLPNQESLGRAAAAWSMGAGSASRTLLPVLLISGPLLGWGWRM